LSQFDVNFGQKLADIAFLLSTQYENHDISAKRTIAYLSLLSIEISLKAMLEKAGIPHETIRGHSHRLSELIKELSKCQVSLNVALVGVARVSATRLRSIQIKIKNAESTVGEIIEASERNTSKYPNQIRYGSVLRHFPPEALAQTAVKVAAFAREHWESLRQRQDGDAT